MRPEVSVVMPVRDAAPYLAGAVRSILEQRFGAFELVAIDDGSRDESPGILAGFAGDARVRIVRAPAAGLVAALNHGLAVARAPLVARMDADDVAHPDRLARQAAAFGPGCALVATAYRTIDASGRPGGVVHPPADLRAALRSRNPIAHPTVMFRRDAVLALGGYRPAFVLAEDFDLWLRVAERHGLVVLDAPLLDYREHGGQSSWTRVEQRAVSEMAALAAAAVRAGGRADRCDGMAAADAVMLGRLGLDERAIAAGIVGRALGTAKHALARGQHAAARAAVDCALRQPGLHPRTRLHLWLLRLRTRG